MAKGSVTGLAHIGVFVKDMNVSLEFYKKLGFVVDKQEDVGVKLAFLSAGNCLIELIEPKEYAPRTNGVVDHVAMTVDCIDTAITEAKAKGITIDESTVATMEILGGVKNVFFEGPDKERLEFFEYLKK